MTEIRQSTIYRLLVILVFTPCHYLPPHSADTNFAPAAVKLIMEQETHRTQSDLVSQSLMMQRREPSAGQTAGCFNKPRGRRVIPVVVLV